MMQMESKSTGTAGVPEELQKLFENYIATFSRVTTPSDVNDAEKALSEALIKRSGKSETEIGAFVRDKLTDIRNRVTSGFSLTGIGTDIVGEIDKASASLDKAARGPRSADYSKI